MYITQFQESSFRPLATFEEDIDVTTGTLSGVGLRGDSLSTWREDVLPFRSRTGSSSSSTQENQAVWLGWNNRIAGSDTTRTGPPGRFVLTLPDTLARGWGLNEGTTLDFMLTALDRTPGPRKDPASEGERGEREEGEEKEAGSDPGGRGGGRGGGIAGAIKGFFSGLLPKGEEEEEPKPPLRLSVQVLDASGNTGKVLLNRYGPVRRPIEIRIQRRKDQRFQGNTEMVLQSYSIPLGDFRGGSGGLDLSSIREIRFLFDESRAGSIVLDHIGLSQMDPEFLRVSGGG
jgi:hypothetical protein